MHSKHDKSHFSQFLPQKYLIKLRGYTMLIVGSLISIGSLVAPNVMILSVKNAWLPVASFIILFAGLIECFDTFISRKTSRFFVNLQFAILDTVVGTVLFFSLGYDANQLSILIAVFLMVKGLFRVICGFLGEFVNSRSTIIGGSISIFLGLLIWALWPLETSISFLSFCLSLEIALRGWALIHFYQWLDKP